LRAAKPAPPGKAGAAAPGRGRRLMRWFLTLLVLLVFAFFGMVVWLAYHELSGAENGVPPLVRAEPGPVKRPPEQRGGLAVVNEESAIVRALEEGEAATRIERLLPRQPPAPRSAEEALGPAASPDEGTATAAEGEGGEEEELSRLALERLESSPEESGETRSDAAPATTDNDDTVAEPASTSGASRDAAGAAAAAEDASDPPPARSEEASSESGAAESAAEERPVVEARAGGSHRVQLVAGSNRDAVERAWGDFQERYPGLLAGLDRHIETITTDAGTLYRLQAGPFTGRAAAVETCDGIKAEGGDCFVVEARR